MPKIVRMFKWGSGEWLTMALDCGHRRRMRRAEAQQLQLVAGKSVGCVECEELLAKLRRVRPAKPMSPREAKAALQKLGREYES